MGLLLKQTNKTIVTNDIRGLVMYRWAHLGQYVLEIIQFNGHRNEIFKKKLSAT